MPLVGRGQGFRARDAIVVAVAAALALPVAPASADPSLDELRRQTEQAESQHARSQAEVERAEQALEELHGRFARTVDEYNAAVERAEQAGARLVELEDSVAALSGALTDRREQVAALVRGLYTSGGNAATLSAVLASGNPRDTALRFAYLRSAQVGQAGAIEGYLAERDVLDRRRADLERRRSEYREVAAELDERRSGLDEALEEQGAELARLESAADRARSELGAAQSAQDDEERRLAQQREERRTEVARADRSTSGGGSGGGGGGDATTATAASASASAPSAAAAAAVQAALSQLGVPYRYGGSSPGSGFDCSGLTSWAYAQAGVNIPRTSRAQFSQLPKVDRSDLQPGDLLFFRNPIGHVGMYIGNGQMVEAPYTGQNVRLRSIDRSDYRGATRPTG